MTIIELIGLEQEKLTVGHMIFRSFIAYVLMTGFTILYKRFAGLGTAFDFVLKVLLGSILANAITGNAPFLPALGTLLFLMIFNWFLAAITFYFPKTAVFIKGTTTLLVKNGVLQRKAMHRHHITEEDLMEEIRKRAHTNQLTDIKYAFFENSGEITVIPYADKK